MPKPLIIGEAPGRTAETDTHVPLYFYPSNSAGARLRRMTGLNRLQYLRAFDRLNILPYFPGARWSKRDHEVASGVAAQLMMGGLLAGRRVVVLGRNAWGALGGRGDVAPFEWYVGPDYIPGRLPRPVLAYHPHPSGRSRVWNDPEIQQRARVFWADLTASIGGEDGKPGGQDRQDPQVPAAQGQASEGAGVVHSKD